MSEAAGVRFTRTPLLLPLLWCCGQKFVRCREISVCLCCLRRFFFRFAQLQQQRSRPLLLTRQSQTHYTRSVELLHTCVACGMRVDDRRSSLLLRR